MEELLTVLDANIEVQVRFPRDTRGLKKHRKAERKAILGCADCGLSSTLPKGCSPTPFSAPDGPARFAIVGEAPGPDEARRGEPFVGRAGKLLRRCMDKAKLDPNDALYANTVSCFPCTDGRRGFRAPAVGEVNACRGHMLTQIELAGSPFVLVVGAVALDAVWRSDFKISDVHGKVFVLNDSYIIMPIHHPSWALRNGRRAVEMITEDLKKWRKVTKGGAQSLRFLGKACSRCVHGATHYDRDGVPFCNDHYAKWGGLWLNERLKRVPKPEPLTIF